jgi:uncharacterized protein involved in type VI secretion and phage assembly
MSLDPYVLERITKARLDELRADAARYAALASVRAIDPGVWASIKGALLGAGRLFGRRGAIRPRPA